MEQGKQEKQYIVDVSIRVLQYPFAQLTTKKERNIKVEYITRQEKVIYQYEDCITTEDVEKLFAAIYLAKYLGHERIEDHDVVITECSLHDIMNLTRLHDYHAIYHALKKFQSLTITIENQTKKLSSGFIYRVEWDHKSNKIEILFYKKFYESCKRGLKLNLSRYIQMSPTAKNIYCVIISHNSYTTFTEEFLIKRGQIEAQQRTKARQVIRKAMKELTNAGIILSFSRNKQKHSYTIIRKINKKKKKNKHK